MLLWIMYIQCRPYHNLPPLVLKARLLCDSAFYASRLEVPEQVLDVMPLGLGLV